VFVAILAVALLGAGALGASAASSPRITNCTSTASRPRLLILACGDGNAALKGLKWSSFGGAVARAKGEFVINDCEPNCAQGKDLSFPVSVSAGGLRTCRGAVRVYGRVTLTFAARRPRSSGSLTHWNLGCPA
jgi:hypothetical protein